MRWTHGRTYGRFMNDLTLDTHHSAPPVQTIRATIRRWHSPTIFALVGLCFLLPFATVSCDNAKTSFTGVQLVAHTVPKGGHLDEAPDCSSDISACVEREASLPAEIALAAAIVGFILAALGVTKGPGWCAGVAFGAMVKLLFTDSILGPDIRYRSGFEAALGLSAWAAVVHLVRAVRRRRAARAGQGEMMSAKKVTT